MKRFAIGDIHGHSIALRALLEALPAGAEDQIIFLGDYVDKGPDVRGTLDLLCNVAEERPGTVFLRGNHDQMLIDARNRPDGYALWETLAGSQPLISYGEARDSRELLERVPERHWDFLERRCVNFFETPDFIFVHAGIRPDRKPEEEEAERLQWMSLSLALPHESGKTVICGHTRNEAGAILDLGHTICIDTGITGGGWLTALELPGFRFHQASAAGSLRAGRLRN